MTNYSTTQATNIATIVGAICLILNHFGINIASDEIMALVGGVLAIGGVLTNWIHRYKQGDLKLSGFRK